MDLTSAGDSRNETSEEVSLVSDDREKRPSESALACLFGFALLVSWVIHISFSTAASFRSSVEEMGVGASISGCETVVAGFLLGAVVAALVFRVGMNRFRHCASLACIVFACSGLACYGLLYLIDPVSLLLLAAGCFICSFGTTFMFFVYLQWLFDLYPHAAVKMLLLCFSIGSALALLLALFQWEGTWIIGAGFCAASLIILGVVAKSNPERSLLSQISVQESDECDHIARIASIPVVLSGFACGFAYYMLLMEPPAFTPTLYAASLTLPVVVWLFCVASGAYVKESHMVLVIQPVYTLLFLLMQVGVRIVSILVCCCLIAFAVFIFILSLCTLFEYVARGGVLVCRLFASMVRNTSLGAIAGVLTAYGMVCFSSDMQRIVLVVIVACFSILLSYTSRRNTYPGEEALYCFNAASCPFRLHSSAERAGFHDARADISPPDSRGGRFVQKCDSIAEECGLTARQREIFVLLAKGRNAEFIGTTLSISPNTARNHIYTIFQKLGVHSHQDLMSFVDTWDT